MSLVGQCPSCHTHYELEAEDIGHALTCECGVGLFVCEVSGFDQLSVRCPECKTDFVLDRDDAGDTVGCDCGAVVPVPTVVFRAALAESSATESGESASRSKAESAAGEKAKRTPVVRCPQCSTEYRVTREDLNVVSECECGCLFTTTLDGNRKLIANRFDGSNLNRQSETKSDEANEASLGRQKQRSWFGIVGTAAVLSLLIGSIVMFVRRNSGEPSEQVSANVAPTTPGTTGAYSPEQLADVIRSAGIRIASSNDGSLGGMDVNVTANGATSNTASADSRSAANEGQAVSKTLRLPPLAERPLPEPVAARERIDPIAVTDRRLTFDKAYETAFAAYRAAKELKRPTDEEGLEAMQSYREQIGKALGLLQQSHDLGMAVNDPETAESRQAQIDELRYFMTWMYYHAGCLEEAAIFGEAVARWGDSDKPTTNEATMLALQSSQELGSTQWGIRDRVGELQRMKSLAEIISKRWPDHPQLESVWMTLAQTYDAYNHPEQAAGIYARIQESSDQYVAAQLAAGNAKWTAFRYRIGNVAEAAQLAPLRNAARAHLVTALEALQADAKSPTPQLVQAKLTLARIDILSGEPAKAVQWLNKEPLAVTASIAVSSPRKNQIEMPKAFVRSVYEALFAAQNLLNDPKGAKAALEQMAKALGPGQAGGVGSKMTDVAFKYVRELKASKRISGAQVKTLEGLLAPIQKRKNGLSTQNRLWIAESWSEFGDKARPAALARQCYDKAAANLRAAMKDRKFPKKMRSSARLRLIQMLRHAGKKNEAMEVIEEILEKTPNIFQLQIEAANALEQMAIEEADPSRLLDSINGPDDSPIWGWSKLVTALHGVRYSDNATETNKQQLLECQFHLARGRWLLARATVDPTDQERSIASVSKMLARLVATTSEDQQPWLNRLKKLQAQIAA